MIESNFNKELEEKIFLYVNGKLTEEEIDDLWAELIQDEYYLDYTKSVANLKAVVESRRENRKTAPIHPIRRYANYGIAAAIALIIGVIGVLNYTTGTTDSTNLQPKTVLELDIYRDANNSPAITNSEIIREAIQLASSGNEEQAIILLKEELTEEHPNELTAEISLTLGSIQYNYGEYEDALDSFLLVVQLEEINELIMEKGYWYLGNTYFQLDRLEEARNAFEETYALNGAYSRVAKTYLDALANPNVR